MSSREFYGELEKFKVLVRDPADTGVECYRSDVYKFVYLNREEFISSEEIWASNARGNYSRIAVQRVVMRDGSSYEIEWDDWHQSVYWQLVQPET